MHNCYLTLFFLKFASSRLVQTATCTNFAPDLFLLGFCSPAPIICSGASIRSLPLANLAGWAQPDLLVRREMSAHRGKKFEGLNLEPVATAQVPNCGVQIILFG